MIIGQTLHNLEGVILDTNIVSEAIRPGPARAVRLWLDTQPAGILYLTAVSQAELLFGIGRLEPGRRKDSLASVVARIEQLFAGRILPFDSAAATRYEELAAAARASGRGFSASDGYIAAIAASRGYAAATRDLSPFHAGGVETIDPWSSDASDKNLRGQGLIRITERANEEGRPNGTRLGVPYQEERHSVHAR